MTTSEYVNKITQGDCLEVMRELDDKSVDMVLCDLPYGTTACKWDAVIPFDLLWEQYERIIKDGGAIVLTAAQPFTTKLISSNFEMFKYELIWNKLQGTGFTLSKIRPLMSHENILIFGKGKVTYNPQMTKREKPLNTKNWKMDKLNSENGNFSSKSGKETKKVYTEKFPLSVIEYHKSAKECNNTKRVHPTQKPLDLFEYLINTYSNEGETVLDNCLGSGTTAVAAINTGRNFIGIERETEYVEIGNQRIEKALADKAGA